MIDEAQKKFINPDTKIIDLRINNAIVRVKKGEDWTAEYIPAKETEKQPGGRFRLPVRPSTRPEYLDGRWPKCS